ncbi:phosphatase PAP2 family protein [Bacillus horti]|nr:phosphatase PAP2 family protein [Bacillus horti]
MFLSLQNFEQRVFYWCNHRIRHTFLDQLLPIITHLGGAVCTIAITLLLIVMTSGEWQAAAIQSLIALTLSHIPIAILKKLFRRKRPYLAITDVNVCKNPLQDYSFPSGHTTAIFAVVTPFIYVAPFLLYVLVPIAGLVALSRIYLGLHYPSDCIVGFLIGTWTAVLTFSLYNSFLG